MDSLFNKLRYTADILAADHSTVVLAGVAAGFEELSGRSLELAQLHSSECTARFTVRWDANISANCYVNFEGVLYPVDSVRDPGVAKPDRTKGQVPRGTLLEIYAHRIQDGTANGIPAGVLFVQQLDGSIVHIRLNPVLSTNLPATPFLEELVFCTDTGNILVWNGTTWVVIGNAPVTSVAGRTGAITLSASDIPDLAAIATSGSIADIAEGVQGYGAVVLDVAPFLSEPSMDNTTIQQNADGTDALLISRHSSAGTGTLIKLLSEANAIIFAVDATGTLTAGAVPMARVTGALPHAQLPALLAGDIPAIAESGVTGLVTDLAAKATAAALTAETSRATTAEGLLATSAALTAETSRATTAEGLLAPLASPALTGNPTAPTQTTGNDSTRIATTAFVEDAIDNLVAADIPALAESGVTGLVSDLAAKVPTSTTVNGHALSSNVVVSASDLTTGTLPHAQLPTLLVGDIPALAESAITSLVSDLALKAPLASPALTGTPTAPTASALDNSTKLATTAYDDAAVGVEKTRALAAEALLANQGAVINVANQGGFWSAGITEYNIGTVGANQNPVSGQSVNQVVIWQFVLKFTITIRNITTNTNVGTGSWNSAGKHYSVAIYSADGTTKLLDTGPLSPSANGNITTAVTPVTLTPGVYWFAQTADALAGSSGLKNIAYGASDSNGNSIAYGYAALTTFVHPRYAIAGNASVAGQMPTTLGTLTTLPAAGGAGTAWAAMQVAGFEP